MALARNAERRPVVARFDGSEHELQRERALLELQKNQLSKGVTERSLNQSQFSIEQQSRVVNEEMAIAEQFMAENSGVRVTVGTSGTGGGFEKFCTGETDISDASRAIEAEEEEACKKGGVGYEELTVATDALTVMINNENPVSCLTVDQLGAIWGPDSKLSNWSEIPNLKEDFDEELAAALARALVARNDLARPDDNFNAASDGAGMFLGRVNRVYGTTVLVSAETWEDGGVLLRYRLESR